MATIAVNDIVSQLDDFSYEEKRTLFQALKASIKRRRPHKIRLARGNNKEPVITKSLMGIFKDTNVTLDEVREERLARQ